MQLKQKFDTGEFAVLAEMEPPKGVDVSTMTDNANRVKGRVDAFIVPEMSNAVMRMSALGGAMILRNNGMETVMQVNCRDRNRIALQADLLAAGASGVANIMAVTGEDPGFGDHHQARSVYDIDLFELLNAIRGLEDGKDMAGIELAGAPDFLVGAAIDAGAQNKSTELVLEDMNKKIDAGAEFFITPPLFDMAAIEPFRKRVDPGVKLIPTVLLLKSLGMARYMARNVDNVFIPDDLIKRLQKAPDKVRECVRVAAETADRIRKEGFSGVLLATIGWEQKLPEILERI
ncbi:MAG: 5,10-methylenetetrahydrofolate reductase [Desulfobacterales bacterium]|nr:5,10-methylenetetrahydrofolate reductase [Desulfobacterales bacterium]